MLADGPAPLSMMLLAHVLAGAVGIVTGYLALYAAKGSTLHRKSGIYFRSRSASAREPIISRFPVPASNTA